MNTCFRLILLLCLALGLMTCDKKEPACLLTVDILVNPVTPSTKLLFAHVTGEVGEVIYTWRKGTFQGNEASLEVEIDGTLNGPGTYTLTVTDFAGCRVTKTIDIQFSTNCPFSVEIVVSGSGSTKTLAAKSLAGIPPYTYLWSTGETDSTIMVTNPVGEYAVTVTDLINCTVSANKSFLPCPLSVTDRTGNEYEVVAIGSQCWTKSNIHSVLSHIPLVEDNEQWSDLNVPAVAYYENNIDMRNTYGLLINGYALSDTTLCPVGWHIPTDAEWQTLIDFLGGDLVAGKALKADTSLWLLSNEESNTSGFSALPGGRRQADGSFIYEGSQAHFWSTTPIEPGSTRLWYRGMAAGIQNTIRIDFGKVHGFSCRCIKN